jgi:predicted nucleotidyltransferase
MLNETAAVREMREFIREKAARRKDRNMRNWRRAAKDAARIITMITREFDPLAVYQWGSVLNAEHFSEISDIDIAVAGLDSAEAFFALVARAEELTDFPLDIVLLEHVEPEYANLIRTYGRCVYMRGRQSLESP